MNTFGSFGSWLRQRRKALDLTQADLADQVGCAKTTIQKIELGKRRPSRQIAERMVDVLALSPDERTTFLTLARHVTVDPLPLPHGSSAFIPAHNLPTQATPFLGRESELAQIAERLADLRCRLLTLIGPGGNGKTRLALQAAANTLEQFTDGVYFISLAPVGSITLIASAIANALQFSFYGHGNPNTQVVDFLRGKHVLLIMDNYEHLLEGIGLLSDMLANAPRLKILVTSRERLNIQEEWTLSVKGLPFPTKVTSTALGSYSAVQLFVESANRVQSGFSLAGNQDAVIDICQAVEGMPLGIELAATWLRAMPCQQISGQIKRNLDFLATPLRNVPTRHRSLRAVFEQSWNLLSGTERDVLMKLSVFRGGIDAEAAEQVAGASLAMIASLVDKSLVRFNPSGRYEMQELLRQYSVDKLAASGQERAAINGHLSYFLALAEQGDQRLRSPHQIAWLDRIEVEHDNLCAALEGTLQQNNAELGLRLATALEWFWKLRDHWIEGSTWFERLLAISSRATESTQVKAFHRAAEIVSFVSLDRAIMLGEKGLALARKTNDLLNMAWSLGALGYVVGKEGDYQRSTTFFEDALQLFRDLKDEWGLSHTLRRLGINLIALGNYERATALAEEALLLAREAGDKSAMAWSLLLLGTVGQHQGIDWQQAKLQTYESLALFQEIHEKQGACLALVSLGDIFLAEEEYERAQSQYEQCLTLALKIGSRTDILNSLIRSTELKRVKPVKVARLFGAINGYGEAIENACAFYFDVGRIIEATRVQLGEAAFATAIAEGRTMKLDQTITDAFS